MKKKDWFITSFVLLEEVAQTEEQPKEEQTEEPEAEAEQAAEAEAEAEPEPEEKPEGGEEEGEVPDPEPVPYTWVDASNGDVPENAVVGGKDEDGCDMYVARAEHENDMLPGKLIPHKEACIVSWGCAEHSKPEYQVRNRNTI